MGMEAKMNGMRKFMHNIFWNENQVTFTFGSDIPIVSGDPPTSNKQTIINSLNLQKLNDFLVGQQFSLSSFTEADTLRPVEEPPSPPIQLRVANDDLNSPIGKYLFSSGEEGQATTVIGFFHFAESTGTQPPGAGSSSMPEKGKSDDDDDDDDRRRRPAKGPVPRIVNLINTHLKELNGLGVPIFAATPVWLCGSTQPLVPTPQGCPAIPPIPVGGDQSCLASPGRWPITLQDLSPEMQATTGRGVTVFIFDTLPQQGQVARAALAAGGNNQLLQDVSSNVIPPPHSHYFKLPDILENPGPNLPKTGKDIYGRLVGFDMPDHGLFIAGIVRDLAPGAAIECMRVLSDYCVGDLATLTKALELIHNRMSLVNPDAHFTQGDLYQKPVVINMSLVIPPTDPEAKHLGFKPKLTDLLRTHLLKPMQRLSELGAVFAASAGNEADLRVGSKAMNPKKVRPFALYPSAFAYNDPPDPVPSIIPVGAVRSDGKPASYSCYPGIKGIATYGGEVPDAIPSKPPKKPPTPTPDCKTHPVDMDAVVGIYCSSTFPSLSIDDCNPTYPAPNQNGWAYWVGTSFATPIISALLARIIQLNGGVLPPHVDLLKDITNAVPAGHVTWTHLDSGIDPVGSEAGRMIKVVQCQPAEEDDEEEVDIEVISVVQKGEEVDIEVIDVIVKE